MTELSASTPRRPPLISGVIHVSSHMAVSLFLSLARPQTGHSAVSMVIGRMAAAWRAPSCSRTPLPSLGMWACLANPNCSGADPNLSQSRKNIAILSQITKGNEATSSPDQPSTLAAVPVCFFASFSSSAPETADHFWISRAGPRVCCRVSRRSDNSGFGRFQTFRQWHARVSRTSAMFWVASSSHSS